MNDLGPEARSNLGSGPRCRGAHPRGSAANQARCALARGHLGAVSTTAGGAVAMSLAAKVTVAALTVAVLGGGSVTLLVRKERAVQAPVASARVASRTAHASPTRPVAVPEAPAVVEEPSAKPVLPRCGVVKWPGPRCDPRSPVSAPVTEVTPAPVPALNSLDPELTVLRQAQEDLRATTACPGPAPAVGIRSPFRQGSTGARTPGHRSRRLVPGSPRSVGPGPGRGFSARCPRIAAGRARAFGVQAILTRFREESKRDCARPGTIATLALCRFN